MTNPESAAEDTADDDDLLVQLKGWFREDANHSSDWRTAAEEDYAFYAGDQIDSETKAILLEQKRPTVQFNRCGPVIDNVAGMEVNNRQEVRYIPRTAGDEGVNETLTGGAKWVRDECDAEDEESDAFLDMAICGMGWTETRMDYETDADGTVAVDRTDPLEMYWDKSAKKRNLGDARRMWHVKEMDREEAETRFPGVDPAALHAGWAMPTASETKTSTSPLTRDYTDSDRVSGRDEERKKVTIVHVQWWDRVTYFRAPGSDTLMELTKEQADTLAERLTALGAGDDQMPFRQVKRVYRRAFLGAEILEQGKCPCPTDFTFKAMTGKRDRNAGTWYGIMRGMKDPQRWANKFFSTTMHSVSTSGKGIIAESDAFENKATAEAQWGMPDAIKWAKPGAISKNKIIPAPAGTLPAGMDRLLEFALTSIRDGTGINLESMGLADRAQAGVLESQRKQSAMTILAPMFDSLRRYRKEQGRVLMHFITTYISDGRLVRIVGQEGAKYVPLIHDPSVQKYDVIVDDSPTSPNQKEYTWATLQGIIPFLLKMNLPGEMWAEILKVTPVPDSFAQKIGAMIMKQAQQPAPPDPKMAEVQAQIQADQQKAASDSQIAQQRQQHDTQLQALKMAGDQKTQQDKLHADIILQQLQQQMLREQQAFEQQLAREKAQFEAQLAAEQAAFAAQLERERTTADMQGQQTKAAAELDIKRKAAEAGGKPGKSNGSTPNIILGLNGEAVKLGDTLDTVAEAVGEISQGLGGIAATNDKLTAILAELAKPKDITVKRSGDKIIGAKVQ